MHLQNLNRIQVVNRFLNLEVDRGKELEDIVLQAAQICQTPVALITLLDDQKQYIRFQVGYNVQEADGKDAFCQYAIQAYDVMEVQDASKDERFAANPFVTGDPHIRFYAAAPLTTRDGHNLGTLCVIDQKPRELDDNQRQILQILSRHAMQLLDFELSIKVLREQIAESKQSGIKLRSFFESTVSCHLLLGKHYDVLDFNKVVSDFIRERFGVSIREGMKIRDFVHPAHLELFTKNYQAALSGETLISEQELRYANDQSIYWYITYEPARTPDGEIIGVSYNATDITERIRRLFAAYSLLRGAPMGFLPP